MSLGLRVGRALCQSLCGLTAGSGRDRFLILTFHRVLARPDPLLPGEPDALRFEWQMRMLREWFVPLGLEEAVARAAQRSLAPGSVAVTFDDGYADNHDVAWPILRKWRIPATFFVSTAFMDAGHMFNDTVITTIRTTALDSIVVPWLGGARLALTSSEDRRRAIDAIIGELKYQAPDHRLELARQLAELAGVTLPHRFMMTREQVRALAADGMDIGAHTREHHILAMLDHARAREEIVGSKVELESLLGRPILAFAYPNGRPGRDYLAEHVQMVRDAGFACAVSTSWGAAASTSDIFQLPRIAPFGGSALTTGLRLAKTYRKIG